MTTFDPKQWEFMDITGGFSTSRSPVPQYPDGIIALIDSISPPRQIETSQDGVPTTSWAFEVTWAVDDEKAKEVTGLPKPTVRQTIWLDFTPTGALDRGKGKNVDLGRLLAAVDLNDPNRPFKPSSLIGRAARIIVAHREDKRSGDTFAYVKKVFHRNEPAKTAA